MCELLRHALDCLSVDALGSAAPVAYCITYGTRRQLHPPHLDPWSVEPLSHIWTHSFAVWSVEQAELLRWHVKMRGRNGALGWSLEDVGTCTP